VLGSEIRPTNRSVIARQRYKSFDGGRRDVSLYDSTKIKVFPRNAVIEEGLFKADRETQWFPRERFVQSKA